MKKIALTGYAGAGKSTIAQIFTQKYNFRKIAFADPLRELVQEQGFNIDKPYLPETRLALQVAGATARKINNNYWIEKLDEKLQLINCNIVIDDLRFKNEAKYLLKKGFIIVRVETPVDIRSARLNSVAVNENQESEKEIGNIPYHIKLDGTIPPKENTEWRKLYEMLGL